MTYVLVAATACSLPASSFTTASAASPSGDDGEFVTAIDGPALALRLAHDLDDVRRLAGLRDADDERAVEPRRLLVQREERRRRERDRDPVRAAEQVLRVARGVRRASARGDQDVLHVAPAEEPGDLLGIRQLLLDQARERRRLVAQLALEMARHRPSTSPAAASDARPPPYVAT